jgi:phosphatidylglycerol lysyltransferase
VDEETRQRRRAAWSKWLHRLGLLVGVGIVVFAVYLLQRILSQIDPAEVWTSLKKIPPEWIWMSIGFTAASMVTMGLYDLVSCRVAGLEKIRASVATTAGFCSYAISNLLGFNVILGGAIRYRIYSAYGTGAADVARILAIGATTVWLAVAFLFGVVLAADPQHIPAIVNVGGPFVSRILGIGILVGFLILLVILGRRGTVISVFGWRMVIPSWRGALAQTTLGAVDFALAAAALFVLLPPDILPGFPGFLLLFVGSLMLGFVSHAPGGLGILEAGILFGLGALNRPDAVAALLVYRVIYFFVPFVVASLVLGYVELRRRTLLRLHGGQS